MLYTNAIYLILALILFAGWPAERPPALKEVLFLFVLKEIFLVGIVFLRLRLVRNPREFLRTQAVLKLLAFLAFAGDVIGLSVPALLPDQPDFLRDILGLGLFLHYFFIIWFFSALYEKRGPLANLSPPAYVWANFKLLLPFLIPWFLASLVFWGLDHLLPFSGTGREVFYLIIFLGALIFLMAPIAVKTWECRPLPESHLRNLIISYLSRERARLKEVYVWETFGGRLLTAGVIGVLPRFRYLLLSTGLLAALEEAEILSVVAHEVGHLKHRHMAWLLLFFVLFSVLMYLSFYPAFLALLAYFPYPQFIGALSQTFLVPEALFTLGLLLAVVLYFRLFLGFFLRNFERQADLYCLESLGTAQGLIRAFKKIAALSGNTEDLPSWHHFSLRERIAFLEKAQAHPRLVEAHHRKVRRWLLIYLGSFFFLAVIFTRLPVEKIEKRAQLNLMYGTLLKEYAILPSFELCKTLGDLAYQMGRDKEAFKWYQKALAEKDDPELVNNLAWLLVTTQRKDLRDPRRGLKLALEATARKLCAVHLDTLAQAFWANEAPQKACFYEILALERARDDLDPYPDLAYYQRQKRKFCHATGQTPALR